MLSSKEIREYTVEKAMFGGYDTKCVDALLDEAADGMEALEKENAELRAKLKVLVDKIEEYRRIEGGLKQALTSAQNIAEQTTKKASTEAEETLRRARTEAEQMKTDANSQCEALMRQYQIQLSQEQARLRLAQRECAVFIDRMTRAFREQSDRIAAIPDQIGLEFTSISDHTVHSETIESRVEGPVEPEPPRERRQPQGTEIPEDIRRIFADAQRAESKHSTPKNGMEETAFTVEVSGSADETKTFSF